MLFHNPNPDPQKFQLGERVYDVPPGADVNIPARMAYVVWTRPLALKPGKNPNPPKAVAPAVVAPALPAEVERLCSSSNVDERTRAAFVAAWQGVDERHFRELLADELARIASRKDTHAEEGRGDGAAFSAAHCDALRREIKRETRRRKIF